MGKSSYLRYNPDTKEIEIEGSEGFIKTYFDKLQQMLLQAPVEVKKEPEPAKALPAKKARVKAKATIEIPAPVKW